MKTDDSISWISLSDWVLILVVVYVAVVSARVEYSSTQLALLSQRVETVPGVPAERLWVDDLIDRGDTSFRAREYAKSEAEYRLTIRMTTTMIEWNRSLPDPDEEAENRLLQIQKLVEAKAEVAKMGHILTGG